MSKQMFQTDRNMLDVFVFLYYQYVRGFQGNLLDIFIINGCLNEWILAF